MSRSFLPRGFVMPEPKVGDHVFGRILTQADIDARKPKETILDPIKPVAEEFSPGEQIALLDMRGSDIACAVLMKLKHSTARATGTDYVALRLRGYAVRKRIPNQRYHELTPRGLHKADELARELAKLFELKPSDYRRERGNSSGFGDSFFR